MPVPCAATGGEASRGKLPIGMIWPASGCGWVTAAVATAGAAGGGGGGGATAGALATSGLMLARLTRDGVAAGAGAAAAGAAAADAAVGRGLMLEKLMREPGFAAGTAGFGSAAVAGGKAVAWARGDGCGDASNDIEYSATSLSPNSACATDQRHNQRAGTSL
eukprot:scaffold14091_cov121-Isochrysis_galbana.AAC.20